MSYAHSPHRPATEKKLERIHFYIPLNVEVWEEGGTVHFRHEFSQIAVSGEDFTHALAKFRMEYAELVHKLLKYRYGNLNQPRNSLPDAT